jgi:hypothetical protein
LPNCETHPTKARSLKAVKGLDDGIVRDLTLCKNNNGAVGGRGKRTHSLCKLGTAYPGLLGALLS